MLALDGYSREARVIGQVAYLRPGVFRNFQGDEEGEFTQFLDTAFDGFREREMRTLLIDLRDNPGGADVFAADLISRFAKKPFRLHENGPSIEPHAEPRFTGKVFVLINRNSYSACAVLAAAVQDQRFGLVIGEKTADLATNQISIETFKLEKSGLVVGFPTATMTRPAGDKAPRAVLPDMLIDTPVIEGPDDPVLRQVFDLMTN